MPAQPTWGAGVREYTHLKSWSRQDSMRDNALQRLNQDDDKFFLPWKPMQEKNLPIKNGLWPRTYRWLSLLPPPSTYPLPWHISIYRSQLHTITISTPSLLSPPWLLSTPLPYPHHHHIHTIIISTPWLLSMRVLSAHLAEGAAGVRHVVEQNTDSVLHIAHLVHICVRL